MPWKRLAICGVLCVAACKKEGEEAPLRVLSPGEILQKMEAREKALSSFSIEVSSEEAGGAVEHTVVFRAPEFIRIEVKQPRKLVLSFDGKNYYRLEEAAKKLTLLHFQLPTAERKMALSMLMGAFVPEGFQSPKVMPTHLKQSWLKSKGSSRILRLENHVSAGSETATIAYVVRWPSLDFLKKEFFVDGRQQMAFEMQEETCMPENHVCFPTRIVAKQDGKTLSPQKINRLSFQEAISNEHFVLQPPEGFAVERHTLSSLEALNSFLH